MNTMGLARDVVAWTTPLACCYFAWAILRRRRIYVVIAAVLCLTPVLVSYPGMGSFIMVWPLILSLPAYVMLLPQSLAGLAYMGLPIGTVIGVIAWFLYGRFLSKNGEQRSRR